MNRAAISRAPLSALQWLFRDKPVGLCYHVVADDASPAVRHLYSYKSPAMFERDLAFLKDHCRVVSYEQLRGEAASYAGKGTTFLTFDDGYRECVSVVRPLLLKYQLPCVFFVVSDFIDNRRLFYRNKVSLCIDRIESMVPEGVAGALSRIGAISSRPLRDRDGMAEWLKALPRAEEAAIDRVCEALDVDCERYLRDARPFMTADEIRMLASDGFVIGGHSCTHARLGELGADEVEDEIVRSCRAIQDVTGQKQVPFAFPYSAEGVELGLLASLRARHDFLGPFFDCRGIRGRDPILVDRLWADPPPDSDEAGSNLGTLLRRAYEEYVLG